jgi:hypothetical protein
MSVVPRKPLEKIQFYEDHIGPWQTNAVAIGTTTGAVTALETQTQAARTAYDEQQAAQELAKAKTLAFKLAVDAMGDLGMGVIEEIRLKARTAGDEVYVLAQIPAPATPGPIPPPGEPNTFRVGVNADGSLWFKWKCVNPPGSSGTIYQVWRRTNSEADFSYVGGSGTRSFIDATLPAGCSSVMYKIQAVRSTAVGPWATFTVMFGVGAGGLTTVSVAPAKIAA